MSLRAPVAFLVVVALCFERADAATQAQIDQSLQRGAQHLLNTQAADGSWDYPGHTEGSTALAAFALLECGVKPSDPAIQRAAQLVRSRASSCTQTYSIALMIFFLDRLGDRRDEPLIVALGERLRNGQNANGAWTYFCAATRGGAGAGSFGGDNSNTQFAILGLWVARRHNVDVKSALERTDKYFRSTQGQDGGWNYPAIVGTRGADGGPVGLGVPVMGTSTGAMTCAGLLGLLVQFGNQAALRAGEAKDLKARPQGRANAAPVDPLKDPAVQAGLKCLERFLMPQGEALDRFGLGTELYFLWSVERVGVAYGLKKIGPVDWYAAGADRVVASQQADGSWSDYSASVGTSLALLFLKRANVAADLTRLVGGESQLRSSRDLEELKNAAAGQAPAAAPAPRSAPARTITAKDLPSMSPEKLKAALPGLGAKQQMAVLEELRDRKGSEATLALAESIANLDESSAAQARKFLVERLRRMTPATLARYLEYEDDEIRQAAAKVAGAKQDRSLIGPLIELLDERNIAVADAAHTALVELTGQQFGNFAGQATANRFVVIQRWKSWWEQQAQKK
jgi:hypothetical protein